jgi:hypothetical protein
MSSGVTHQATDISTQEMPVSNEVPQKKLALKPQKVTTTNALYTG